MAEAAFPSDVLKQARKEALQETLMEQRELFREIFAEVLEDFALAEAINEGRPVMQRQSQADRGHPGGARVRISFRQIFERDQKKLSGITAITTGSASPTIESAWS